MDNEKLKEAFSKIKQDMFSLGDEISEIRRQLLESNQLMQQINNEITEIKLQNIEKNSENYEKTIEKTLTDNATHNLETSTHPVTSTQTSTHPQEIEGLKTSNLHISIGNQGASTDRQTNRQTDEKPPQDILRQIISRKTQIFPKTTENVVTKYPETDQTSQQNQEFVVDKSFEKEINQEDLKKNKDNLDQDRVPETVQNTGQNQENTEKSISQDISDASELLDSLDNLKKQIRRKFKRITRQEMLVFSTIYTMEEQDREGVDYKKISFKLGLSQSSIRDYVQRMIEKGIPIIKEKINNKKIILHISKELKKIASLNTIIQLRDI